MTFAKASKFKNMSKRVARHLNSFNKKILVI